jgi:hypothetical protein
VLGRAAIVMWWDFPREMQPEIEDWHAHEHFPERLGVPGFLRGSRWIDLAGRPSYFIAYEAARLGTITTGPYLERLNNPTPWSRRMMPYHLNMVRSLCRVRAHFGGGHAYAMATVRFSPRRRSAVARWLAEDVLPGIPKRKGLTGAHLLRSESMRVAETAEQKIRGGDGAADWVLLLNGYDADAVQALVADELSPDALAARGAIPGAAAGVYRLAYSATAKDFP